MKNKLANNFLTSTEIVDNLLDTAQQQRLVKSNHRRESIAPKIVICPPVEEMTETVPSPPEVRVYKAISQRISRHAADSDSVRSSSSNDSVSDRTDQDRSDGSTSESGSDGSKHHRRRRSTVSLRRVLESLKLTSRSRSCSSTERSRPPKKQPQPKRILRPPVTYTYVRGLSGLPTQRVPRNTCYATSGLNR